MAKITFKDEVVVREVPDLVRRFDSVGVVGKGGEVNPPIVRRSVYKNGLLVESFDFDSIADPEDKVFEEFIKKYGVR